MTMWLQASAGGHPIQVNLDQVLWITGQAGEDATLHYETTELKIDMSVTTVKQFIHDRQSVESPVRIQRP
jgi:hypothetical protein